LDQPAQRNRVGRDGDLLPRAVCGEERLLPRHVRLPVQRLHRLPPVRDVRVTAGAAVSPLPQLRLDGMRVREAGGDRRLDRPLGPQERVGVVDLTPDDLGALHLHPPRVLPGRAELLVVDGDAERVNVAEVPAVVHPREVPVAGRAQAEARNDQVARRLFDPDGGRVDVVVEDAEPPVQLVHGVDEICDPPRRELPLWWANM